MTSRERILAAIEHREPDRVPIDCGAMRSTGIAAIAYGRLRAHLGLAARPVRVFDVIQQLAEPDEDYLRRFRIDAVNAGREWPWARWKAWSLPDESPGEILESMDFRREGGDQVAYSPAGEPIARMHAGARYFSQTLHPLNRPDWESLLNDVPAQIGRCCWANLPEPMYAGGLSDENLARIREHVAGFRPGGQEARAPEDTTAALGGRPSRPPLPHSQGGPDARPPENTRAPADRAVMVAFGANLFEWGAYLRRMDNFLMDLAGEPTKAEALLDKLLECHLAGLDRLLPALGTHVDLIQLGDDLGTEGGPFFSPAMYRRFFKPRHAAIIRRVRELAPHMKIFLHCCGSIYKLLPDLIEIGVQVLNPVQISARNMDPARLKREFGKDITFWGGGCDTQAVLPRGTPQEVRDHVRRNIDILAPGGGFVFNQVHNILSEVPPANIEAMYAAAME